MKEKKNKSKKLGVKSRASAEEEEEEAAVHRRQSGRQASPSTAGATGSTDKKRCKRTRTHSNVNQPEAKEQEGTRRKKGKAADGGGRKGQDKAGTKAKGCSDAGGTATLASMAKGAVGSSCVAAPSAAECVEEAGKEEEREEEEGRRRTLFVGNVSLLAGQVKCKSALRAAFQRCARA